MSGCRCMFASLVHSVLKNKNFISLHIYILFDEARKRFQFTKTIDKNYVFYPFHSKKR